MNTLDTAISVDGHDKMIEKIKWLDLHPVEYQGIADRLDQYFNKNKGATEKTYNIISSLHSIQ